MASILTPRSTQLQDQIEYGDKGMFRKYLVNDKQQRVMLICLRSGIQIPENSSSSDSFLTIIEGRGLFLLAEQEVILEPGVFIELPAHTPHALTVFENLAMLKVVPNLEPEPATGSKKALCQKPRCCAVTVTHCDHKPPSQYNLSQEA